MRNFTSRARFVTIPAWESSNAYGHANLYLRTPEVDGGTWHWKPELCPSEVVWDEDVGHGAATIPTADSPSNTASTARSWAQDVLLVSVPLGIPQQAG